MQRKALLIVLTGDLCIEGGVADLPQRIDMPRSLSAFFKVVVADTICALYSSMKLSTLAELLRRLLPASTLRGFLYVATGEKPDKSDPYPNRLETLKFILGSPRERNILWNHTIALLEVDPLKWPMTRILEPPIRVMDDVDPLKLQQKYYARKHMYIGS